MYRNCIILGITALLSSGLPAFAQDQTTSDDATASQAIQDQLSLGTEADESAELGQIYTAEVIDDWEMRCIKTEEAEDPCQMYQLINDEQGQPIAEFSLYRLPEGGRAVAGATVIVPLETALPNQLTIKVDDESARRYPFAFCAAVGCYARVGLTEEDIAAYKAGKSARISIVPAAAPDQVVGVDLSLAGFTASYDKVSTITP